MNWIVEAVALVSMAFGLFFMMVGVLGLLRFPDVYNRIHAASKCTTLGLLGLLIAAVLHVGTFGVFTKAVLTLVFAFVATPVGSHMLAKAAHRDGAPQWGKTLSDELAEDRGEA